MNKTLTFHELGFAKTEPHRIARQGFPEAIYCPGKTIAQIVSIFQSLSKGPGPVLATRATVKVARAIQKRFPKAVYHSEARMVVWKPLALTTDTVFVLSAGTADMPVAEEAAVTAQA